MIDTHQVSARRKCEYTRAYERISIPGLTMAERLKHDIPASDTVLLPSIDPIQATRLSNNPRSYKFSTSFAADFIRRSSRGGHKGVARRKIDSLLLRAFRYHFRYRFSVSRIKFSTYFCRSRTETSKDQRSPSGVSQSVTIAPPRPFHPSQSTNQVEKKRT